MGRHLRSAPPRGDGLAAPGAEGSTTTGLLQTGRYPRVVELVGPAGVGKTTLCRELGRRAVAVVAGFPISKHLHLSTALTLLPTYVGLHWPPRALLWPEMKRITYLRTLWRALKHNGPRPYGTILLDEGPVYFHARTLVFGGHRVMSPGFERWWQGSIRAWARMLALVVVLDAPDAVLAARIRDRAYTPRGRGSRDFAERYLITDYRRAYDRVLGDLTAAGDISVIRFDTSTDPIEAIADRLIAKGLI